MSGLVARLDAAVARLEAIALAAPGATRCETPDWLHRAAAEGALRRPIAWRNTVVRTPRLRRLHAEFFSIPGEIGVLHLCAFPADDAALPILGFDVVAGQQRATGCFLDLSPTVPQAEPLVAHWAAGLAPSGEPRVLPDWAAMFSPHAVAVRPRDAAELEAGLAAGEAALRMILAAAPMRADPAAMHAAQARYVEGQRRNDRTRRMLAGCIGADLAERFIAECLFPLPDDAPALRDAA